MLAVSSLSSPLINPQQKKCCPLTQEKATTVALWSISLATFSMTTFVGSLIVICSVDDQTVHDIAAKTLLGSGIAAASFLTVTLCAMIATKPLVDDCCFN
jgi:hypothetical protein